jgi:pimeloyl-ACP methyl ester carboxylesterase
MNLTLTRPVPNVRETGAGPGVVCLHCNASSAAQWGGLMALLAPRYKVLAPELYGAGRSPEWPLPRPRSLADEVDLIEPVLERAGPNAVLVGHSYGGAVALLAATRHRHRGRALALYEPTLFSLIDQDSPPPNAADGIRLAAASAAEAVERGDHDEAARHFIDYWSGSGAWGRTPASRRQPVTYSIRDVGSWAHALFSEPSTAESFRSLDVPVLYMTGSDTTASARGVARILTAILPNVRVREFQGLGHMGPMQDPGAVNDAIERLLFEIDSR